MNVVAMHAQAPGPGDRLDSWKEIAAYLKRGVRTVQRWEHTHALPVHRLEHDRQSSVYAFRGELDGWWENRRRQLDGIPPPPPGRRTAQPRIWLGAGLALALVILILFGRPRTSAGVAFKALEAAPLTSDLGDEESPTLSPDGSQVAYAWNGPSQNNFDIYVKMIGSDTPLRLTSDPEPDGVPAWSPDGKQIAFLRFLPKGKVNLILISPLGGPERIIADVGPGGSLLAWTPDGQWIVTRDGGVSPPSLVAISQTTGERRRLTSAPRDNGGDFDPAVAPDGSSVVFVREHGNILNLYQQLLSAQLRPTGEPIRLTDTDSWIGTPSFTADGKAILYSAGLYEEDLGLWILPLGQQRSAPRLLLKPGGQVFTPVASRRGHRLVFAVQKKQRSDTWTMNLGSDFHPVGEPVRSISSSHTDYNAQYSPDGSNVVFHSTRSGMSEIWTADANGQHAVRLTNLSAPITGSPRWSPDGKWITFDSNSGGQFHVYRIRSDGGVPEQLTRGPSLDAVPSWSRDARSIYFVSDRSGTYQVWKMSADGAHPRQVSRNGGYVAYESLDGKWIYFTRRIGCGPLIRAPVEGGEETQVIPQADEFNFTATSRGVLFARSPQLIEFFDFRSGSIVPFAHTPRRLRIGLAISPDERHLLFSQRADDSGPQGSDLMFVENFQGNSN